MRSAVTRTSAWALLAGAVIEWRSAGGNHAGEMREGRCGTADAALPLYRNRCSLLLGHQDRQDEHGSSGLRVS